MRLTACYREPLVLMEKNTGKERKKGEGRIKLAMARPGQLSCTEIWFESNFGGLLTPVMK